MVSNGLQVFFRLLQVIILIKLAQSELADKCKSKDTCHDCIQLKDCAWCTDPNYGGQYRCWNEQILKTTANCNAKFIDNAENHGTIVLNKNPTKKGQAGKIVQMRPQKLKLKLRVDRPYKFRIQYTQSADYPVDLYFLMDLSKTMEDDKNKILELGHTLGTEMQKISNDFHLGFGSFVDKTILPFTGKSMKNEPYGFRNQLSLTSNINEFSKSVKNAVISGNNDTPEGSFDALMQAIVCKKEIGWRNQSRKLIILATDAGFHQALDGKLAGIIVPNDGKCHLDKNGIYTYSAIQDYPSISQINLKAKENSMNIIFAVTSDMMKIYEKLTNFISGSHVAKLTTDSSNIVALIKEQYNKISTTIELKDNASDGIKLKYESKCLKNGEVKNTNKCSTVALGESVEFSVTATLTSCPKDTKEWSKNITISPVGVDEKLEIELHMLCACDCEKNRQMKKSSLCNKNGWMTCGLCQCDNDHMGTKCECSANTDIINNNATDLSTQCIKDGKTCSERGECACGICKCNENHIKGKYCQCDDTSCERNGLGLLCSGPDQGTCDCGVCQCREGWEGSDCSCQTGTESCRRRPNEEICSGRGKCKCGKCRCNTAEARYDGAYCEKCPTCSDDCLKHKDCVECLMYQTGKLATDCKRVCTAFNTTGHMNLTEFEKKEDFRMCTFYDANECRFRFVYSDIFGESFKVHAQNTLECKPKVKLEDVLYISIMTIVLVGILTLLLWKIITTIHDRKEYAKFLKEKENWKPVQNPLFVDGSKTVTNPTFGKD